MLATDECQRELCSASLTLLIKYTKEPSVPSDAELIARLADGCEASFTAFYERHADALYRFALAVSASRAVAEEATQEVMLHVMQRPQQFDAGRSANARNWLYGILRNQVRVLLRGTSGDARAADGDQPSVRSAESEAAWLQMQQGIGKAIAALPLDQREALVMCCLQDVDYAAAAQILGVPVGTIRSRINRARTALKGNFEAQQGVALEELKYECY